MVPCVEDGGKAPKFTGWERKRLSSETIAKLTRRYPEANIGLVCGLSDIVVVDIDDPSLFDVMWERFGPTPLIVRTPSSNSISTTVRSARVNSTNLNSEGLKVDIKADGGQVVIPPSFNRKSNIAYEFERGSWDDLKNLPPIRQGALPWTDDFGEIVATAQEHGVERYGRRGDARYDCVLSRDA